MKRYRYDQSVETGDRLAGLWCEFEQALDRPSDLAALFVNLSRELQQEYEIKKGFMALRDGNYTRFLAVARFKAGGPCKKLSLKLPSVDSLFEKVAESGQVFADNYAELFDGNRMEKRLLIDDDTVSYLLRPLKYEGRVVGLIGYSSDQPGTFITLEEGRLDPFFEILGAIIGSQQPVPETA
jgi:hypothetical protein